MTSPEYGDLIKIDPQSGVLLEVLNRVPLRDRASDGSVSEGELQNLLFQFPQALPIAAIDSAYSAPVPVCQELSTPAGFIDALYINPKGRLILAEFKLWRNPQARREVIGQILDYANALASWSYEDLQRQVSMSRNRAGNTPYELVKEHSPNLHEAEFVDNVTRHLKRGDFLLLIIGDGIQENVVSIVDFVQRYSGLHFNLALVEAALYRDSSDHLIVQPRVLARTEIVQRFVVNVNAAEVAEPEDVEERPADQREEQNLRYWSAVLKDFQFADSTVEVPNASSGPSVFVSVRKSGFGNEGMWFGGYLYRSTPSGLGCYVSARRGIERAERVLDELRQSLSELREELGSGLESWENSQGRPRIGFRFHGDLSFLARSEDGDEYTKAVSWMREHLNTLVSGLNPRIRSRLDE